MKQAFVVILASLLLSSCGFYKRQYTSGWMISHHHVPAKQNLSSNDAAAHVTASAEEEQISVQPIVHISPTDTIQPDPKDNTQQSAVPNIAPAEPDFYTAPPKEDTINDSHPSHNQQLIQRTFDKRVKNATRAMKSMFIGFGYAILLTGLALNSVIDEEIAMIISALGIIVAIVALIAMFYFTYKSFELIVNNPDVKFNADSRSKLIIPAVLSILFSGYIGLIFALVLVIKNGRNKK
jgi:heme/copper-type cytochrome/quinol oxidase subunit 4